MEGIGYDCQRVGVLLGVDVLPLAGDVVDAPVHRVPEVGVQVVLVVQEREHHKRCQRNGIVLVLY